MADLPTLRAKVEAAQALAANATPGPYHLEVAATPAGETPWGEVVLRHHPAGGAGTPIPGLRVTWQGRAGWGEPGRANASLLAAAPNLVALAVDLLAALDVSERRHRHRDDVEKDMARQRDEARAELTAIRAALGNGADEAAWRPGETMAGAVGRLREDLTAAREELAIYVPRSVCRHVVSQRRIQGTTYFILCILPAGHEGPHAEALGNGGPNG